MAATPDPAATASVIFSYATDWGFVSGQSGKEMSASTPTILLSASIPLAHLLMLCPRMPPGRDTMSPHLHPPFAPFTRHTFAALRSPWCRGHDMTPSSPLRVAMGCDTMSPPLGTSPGTRHNVAATSPPLRCLGARHDVAAPFS